MYLSLHSNKVSPLSHKQGHIGGTRDLILGSIVCAKIPVAK